MFKWPIPQRKGAELEPHTIYPPTAIRKRIVVPPFFANTVEKETLYAVADRMLYGLAGELSRAYTAQRANAHAGVQEYHKKFLQFPGVDMYVTVMQKQELIELVIYPLLPEDAPIKIWRVDYSYRKRTRAAGELYDDSTIIYDPDDQEYLTNLNGVGEGAHRTPETAYDGINDEGGDALWSIREFPPPELGAWLDEAEKAQVAFVSYSVNRTGTYNYGGFLGGQVIYWNDYTLEYSLSDIRITISYPAREGTLVEGRIYFMTTTGKPEGSLIREGDLDETIETWWTEFQADIIASDAEPEYSAFQKDEKVRVRKFPDPMDGSIYTPPP